MLAFAGALTLLLVAAGFLIRIPAIQTRVVNYIATSFSESLNAKVTIGYVDIEFFRTLRLDDVYVEDQLGDTLLFAGAIYSSIDKLDIRNKTFHLDVADLESAFVHIYIPEGDSVSNIRFLIDALKSDSPPDSMPVVFALDEIEVRNSAFRFDDFNKADTSEGINFGHIYATDIQAVAHGFEVSDSISFYIDELSLKEKSGFIIHQLQTAGSYSERHMIFDELVLKTPQTSLEGHYSMHYSAPEDFGNFLEDVSLRGAFEKSTVDFDDIAMFAPALMGINRTVIFDGEVTGPVSNLRCRNAQIWYGDETYLNGEITLRGLPDFESTLITARIKKLNTSIDAIETVPIPPFSSEKTVSLGPELGRLGRIDFQGSYTGFVHDFVAYGSAQTSLGPVTADINLKNKGEEEPIRYSGKVASTGFNIGHLVNASEQVGNIGFKLNINGSNFDWREMSTEVEGTVSHIDILKYRYNNIAINGEWDRGSFDGLLKIEDQNLNLDFNGKVDLSTDVPEFRFLADVRHLDLHGLGLTGTDTFGILSGKIACNFSGKSINQAEGEILATNIVYVDNVDSVILDSFYLSEEATASGRLITLETDNLSAILEGEVNTVYLPNSLLHSAARYFPLYLDPAKLRPISHPQVFDLTLKLSRHSNVLGYFVPELTLYESLEVKGSYSDIENELQVTSSIEKVGYKEIMAENIGVSVTGDRDSLTAEITSEQVLLANGGVLQNVDLTAVGANNKAFTRLGWENETGSGDQGLIAIDLEAIGKGHMGITVNPSNFQLSGINWQLDRATRIEIDSSRISVDNLLIRSGEGSISAQGILSGSPRETFVTRIKNLDLGYINSFLPAGEVSYHGTLNGVSRLKSALGDLMVSADMTIDSFRLNTTPIGNIMFETDYSEELQTIRLSGNLEYENTKAVRVEGTYKPFQQGNNLDLRAEIEEFNVVNIQPFIEKVLSGLEGTASGSLNVTGNLKEPVVDGVVKLEDIGLRVNYLNTYYRLPYGEAHVSEGLIGLDAAKLVDEKLNTASVTATVVHDNFKDFNYDIFVEAVQFQGLNTTIAHNDQYYGTAYLTGDVSISGYESFTNIQLAGKTGKDTRFFIPLDRPDDISQADFIRFIDTSEVVAEVDEREESSLQGISLDIQLEATEDAEVQIIFDEKIGDIIKGRGNGVILMDINNRGKFNMYGEYTITNGDYLFTLQNVINKRFSVQPGGNIIWSGSPYAAQVDLTAVYSLRTSPIDLTPADSTNSAYKQRMPVDVYLNMDGALLEPSITFDIDVPGLPESDLINQLLSANNLSEQEMNEQVFSLLLLNRFSSTQDVGQASGIVGSTGTEALSNQLSNWVSQYFNKVDVGVNLAQDQREVAISTQLFQDRVLVEGSVQGRGTSASEAGEQGGNLAGEINVEYKISEDGNVRARAFNEANNYNAVHLNQSPYTQGVGVFYRREFDSLSDFFRNIFKKKEKRRNESLP